MTLAAMLAMAVGASAAVAKPPPGVHIDPGSPVAKEYAIPLAQARAGGNAGGSGQLFGRGITHSPSPATSPAPSAPPSAASSGAATTADPGSRHERRRAHRAGAHPGSARKHQARHLAAAPQLSRPDSSAGGGAGIAWMLGAAALVLALGGLGGAVLARHGRGTGATTSSS